MYQAYTISLVLCMADMTTTTPLQPCRTTTQFSPTISYFNRNEEPLPTITYSTLITKTDVTECIIDTSELVTKIDISRPTFYDISFECDKHQHVHLSDNDAGRNTDIIAVLRLMSNCTFDKKSVNTLMNIVDTIALQGIIDIDTTEETETEIDFRNIVTFVWRRLEGRKRNLSDILNEKMIYTNLVEVNLDSTNLDIPMDTMKHMLPNLQSLEITNTNLTEPPDLFPWTDTMVELPRNLSRSQIMESRYIRSEYIKVPPNLFRRYFNLASNRITNLSSYSFHGILHKISLADNGLHSFSKGTFSNVQGLQNIDLSKNELVSLPYGTFSNLDKLRKLDISGNKLTYLPPNVFDDLNSLQNLDFSNNSIESLPDGIFLRLVNLELIRLEHNRLLNLNPSALPLESVYLKEIYLQYNPLTELPVSLFQIRGLRVANLQGTNITIQNLTQFLESLNYNAVWNSVVDVKADMGDFLQRQENRRIIELSNCNISSLDLVDLKLLPMRLHKLLLILLLHFEFILTDNPIKCDCRNNNFVKFIDIAVKNGTFSRNEYFYDNWICAKPMELKNRQVLSIRPVETYCKTNIDNCPSDCECYKRDVTNNVIVDCRNRNLTSIHDILPDGNLELWYSNNNITSLTNVVLSANIVSLDLGSNKLERIDDNLVTKMINLKELKVQNNLLVYLPRSLESMHLESAEIWPSPFTCDCNSLWMKKWLFAHRFVVNDWDMITCKADGEDGMTFVWTPDEKFTCNSPTPFNEIRYVVMPSIVCSFVVVFAAVATVVIYTYRLECKVLLFVYFGVHPFDDDSDDMNEHIDCVIVHSEKDTDWVMENIVSVLESESYEFVVCDMARDFVVGYSFQENLTRTVRHSKRMIFCVSPDWDNNVDDFKTAWRIAQEKIKDSKSHYTIVVTHEIDVNDIGDSDMKLLIKQGRYVNPSEKLFGDKIVYYMPQQPKQIKTDSVRSKTKSQNSEYITKCFKDSVYPSEELPKYAPQEHIKDPFAPVKGSQVYISYHDNDLEYVMTKLIPLLEANDYTYCMADKDFIPGASKEENILNAMNGSDRTMYVMSKAHVADEWSLFTFRIAYERSLREQYNHLLVIKKENVDSEIIDAEMKYYVQKYICLNSNDRWFEKRLISSLPRQKEGKLL